jgi:hypothetical protein
MQIHWTRGVRIYEEITEEVFFFYESCKDSCWAL